MAGALRSVTYEMVDVTHSLLKTQKATHLQNQTAQPLTNNGSNMHMVSGEKHENGTYPCRWEGEAYAMKSATRRRHKARCEYILVEDPMIIGKIRCLGTRKSKDI